MRNKRLSAVVLFLGIVMIAVSAAFFVVQLIRKAQNTAAIPAIVEKMEKILPDRSAGVIEKRADNTMPVAEINGADFIGLLELPDRQIKLPVSARWSGSGSECTSARYSGSLYDGTLVIGGKYERGIFDFADQLDAGEEVRFTDMTGRVFRYSVSKISHSDHAGIDALTDSDCPLTLFVKKGHTFLIIRCSAV